MPIVIKQKNVIPAVKNGIYHPFYAKHPKLKTFYQQLLQSRAMPLHPAWVELQEQITRGIEKVLINDDDSRKTMEQAAERIDWILAHYQEN